MTALYCVCLQDAVSFFGRMPSTLGPEIHLPKHTGDACVRLFGGLH